MEEFSYAILREIELQKDYLGSQLVQTIYFGGGTPSLLKPGQIELIISALQKQFTFEPAVEITLEANPDDVDADKLMDWKKLGINRLSIGVQSFRDEDLSYLKRVHSASASFKAIEWARDAGFKNLSIDLIYGLPTLGAKAWEDNLSIFAASGIPHLSAYCLTLETGTQFEHLVNNGRLQPPDESVGAVHFEILKAWSESNGFQQYEVSNFCKGGQYSKHNLSYWKGIPYLGLGPSAHSYNGESRQWNLSDLGKYIRELNQERMIFEFEALSPEQKINEYIMTSLRTCWGCDLEKVGREADYKSLEHIGKKISSFIERDWMEKDGNRIRLKGKGWLFADAIASELFIVY